MRCGKARRFVKLGYIGFIDEMAVSLMTQAAYARHQGVTRQAVGIWAKNGVLKLVEDPNNPGKKLVDVDKSDLSISSKVDKFRGRDRGSEPNKKPRRAAKAKPVPAPADPPKAKAKPPAQTQDDDGQPETLEKVRTGLLKQQTEGHRLKNALAAGDLVMKVEAERRIGEFGRKIRNKIYAVIRDKSEKLARIDEPRTIIDILTSDFDAALIEIANSIETEES